MIIFCPLVPGNSCHKIKRERQPEHEKNLLFYDGRPFSAIRESPHHSYQRNKMGVERLGIRSNKAFNFFFSCYRIFLIFSNRHKLQNLYFSEGTLPGDKLKGEEKVESAIVRQGVREGY